MPTFVYVGLTILILIAAALAVWVIAGLVAALRRRKMRDL